MRAPEEVYKAGQRGAPTAAEELSREERTRLRAKKKRAGKKRKLQQVPALLCQGLPFKEFAPGLRRSYGLCMLAALLLYCMHGLLLGNGQVSCNKAVLSLPPYLLLGC